MSAALYARPVMATYKGKRMRVLAISESIRRKYFHLKGKDGVQERGIPAMELYDVKIFNSYRDIDEVFWSKLERSSKISEDIGKPHQDIVDIVKPEKIGKIYGLTCREIDCKKDFESIFINAGYCSDSCYGRTTRRRNRETAMLTSRKSRAKQRENHVPVVAHCEICGDEYEQPFDKRHHKNICGDECTDLRRKQWARKNHEKRVREGKYKDRKLHS